MKTKLAFHEIMQMPVVSTGYVTESDLVLCERHDADNPITGYAYEYGYWMSVSEDGSDADIHQQLTTFGYSENFCDLYLGTRAAGMSYLRLDSDGAGVDSLEMLE